MFPRNKDKDKEKDEGGDVSTPAPDTEINSLPDEPVAEEIEKDEGSAVAECAHLNLHHYEASSKKDKKGRIIDGQQGERLLCELPEGHDGDHYAKYHYEKFSNDELVDEDPEAESYWSDMAGVPYKDVPLGADPGISNAARLAALDADKMQKLLDMAEKL